MADLQPSSSWIIQPNELQLEQETHIAGRHIAQGRWRKHLVVVKVLSEQAKLPTLHARGELWTSLQHAHVLRTFGVSLEADPLYVVTEHQPNGNVARYLERNLQADRAKLVYEVAAGMQYLHERGVVHGSLRPANILIKDDGTACISDYGMMEVQSSGGEGHRYFSPEAWKGTLSRSSDVFAWAMSALEIFTSKPPWGILSEKQIFAFVVQEQTRPERPDEDFGLTDGIWFIIERCWEQDSRQRPTFQTLVQHLPNSIHAADAEAMGDGPQRFNRNSLVPQRALSRSFSARTVPPAYEPFSSPPPESAPATRTHFGVSSLQSPARTEFSARSLYGGNDTNSILSSEPRSGSLLPRRTSLMTSSSSSSSGGPRSNNSSWTSASSSSRSAPNRFGKDPETPRGLPPIPSPIPEDASIYSVERRRSIQIPHNLSVDSLFSQPSSISTTTVPNATLIVGALLAEIKEGRQRDVIDPLISNIQKLGRRSHKDAQKLVTAGAIPALILLLKTRAVYGIGLEIVLIALGVLTHDPITANTIYRTNTTATLMGIADAAQTDNITALALWCLARISRNPEIAAGLLKQNLGRLLVSKG
ncbi:kinase-like domain-containing protein, partial [Mycena filopes]